MKHVFRCKIEGFDDFTFFVYCSAVPTWLSAIVYLGINNGCTGFFLFRNGAKGANNVIVIVAVSGGNIIQIVPEIKLFSVKNIEL